MCSNLRTHRYDPEEDWGLSVVRLVSLDDQCETILGWRWKWICYWLKCWIKWSVREVSVSFVSGDEGGRMFWMSWAAGRMRTMKVCKELNWRPQPLVTAMFFLFTSSSSHVGATEPPDGPTTPPVGSPQLSTGSRSFWSLWFDVKQQWRVRTDGGLGGGCYTWPVQESRGSVFTVHWAQGGLRSCRQQTDTCWLPQSYCRRSNRVRTETRTSLENSTRTGGDY